MFRQGEAGVQFLQLRLQGNGPEQEGLALAPVGELPVAGQEEAPFPECAFQESGIVGLGAEEGVEAGETEMAGQTAQMAVGQKARGRHRGRGIAFDLDPRRPSKRNVLHHPDLRSLSIKSRPYFSLGTLPATGERNQRRISK